MKHCIYISLWILLLGFAACSAEKDDLSSLTEKDGVRIGLGVTLQNGPDIDHEVIPMRASVPATVNNFCVQRAAILVLRDVNETHYVVEHTQLGELWGDQTAFHLADNKLSMEKLGLPNEIILQPGRYRLCLVVNGPTITLRNGSWVAKDESIWGEPESYTRSLLETYYGSVEVNVTKDQYLTSDGVSNGMLNFKLIKYAAPVRFILELNNDSQVLSQLSNGAMLGLTINADGNSLFSCGMTASGALLPATDVPLTMEKSSLLRKLCNMGNEKYWMITSYEFSSVFIPFFLTYPEGDTKVSIILNRITDRSEGWSTQIETTDLGEFWVKRDYLTTVLIKLDGMEVSVERDESLIRQQWEAAYPDIPFEYMDYN